MGDPFKDLWNSPVKKPPAAVPAAAATPQRPAQASNPGISDAAFASLFGASKSPAPAAGRPGPAVHGLDPLGGFGGAAPPPAQPPRGGSLLSGMGGMGSGTPPPRAGTPAAAGAAGAGRGDMLGDLDPLAPRGPSPMPMRQEPAASTSLFPGFAPAPTPPAPTPAARPPAPSPAPVAAPAPPPAPAPAPAPVPVATPSPAQAAAQAVLAQQRAGTPSGSPAAPTPDMQRQQQQQHKERVQRLFAALPHLTRDELGQILTEVVVGSAEAALAVERLLEQVRQNRSRTPVAEETPAPNGSERPARQPKAPQAQEAGAGTFWDDQEKPRRQRPDEEEGHRGFAESAKENAKKVGQNVMGGLKSFGKWIKKQTRDRETEDDYADIPDDDEPPRPEPEPVRRPARTLPREPEPREREPDRGAWGSDKPDAYQGYGFGGAPPAPRTPPPPAAAPAPAPPPVVAEPPAPRPPTPDRELLRQQKQDAQDAKIKEAKEAFERKVAAEEQHREDLRAAEDVVGPKIAAWANEKRKSNIIGLLGSLHTITWPGSGWEEVSMATLMTPAGLKKAFHKACLKLYPDKIPTDSPPEIRKLSTEIAYILNAAMEEHKAKH